MGKQKKIQRKGRCAFCGAFGLTREHVMPQWVRDLPGVNEIREAADNHRQKLITRTAYVAVGDRQPQAILVPDIRGSRRHTTNTILRQLCKDCNTGWMSSLEDEARPVVSRLEASDTLQSIDAATADVLARWAFKTAAVWELDDLRTRAIDPADVLRLRDGLGLRPERIEVYVFHLNDPARHLGLAHVGGPVLSDGLDEPAGSASEHVGTLATATVCVLRLGFLIRYVCGLRMEFLGPVTDSRLTRVFPFDGPVAWPTGEGLTDTETVEHCNGAYGVSRSADHIQSMRVPRNEMQDVMPGEA